MPSQKALSLDDALGVVVTDKSGKLPLDVALQQVQEVKKEQTKSGRTWADWLPAIGGAIGGFAGGIPGAALGGAAGEGYKQLANNLSEIPGAVADVARNALAAPGDTIAAGMAGAARGGGMAALKGAEQGGAQLLGGLAARPAEAVARGVRAVATPIMRSALGRTEATLAQKPDVAKVALEAGANVTRSGAAKLDALIASRSGLADKAALKATRDAVAAAWNRGGGRVSGYAGAGAVGAGLGFGAGGPVGGAIGAVLAAGARNPAILSAMANGLYHAAGFMAQVPPNAIRAALLGMESAAGEQ